MAESSRSRRESATCTEAHADATIETVLRTVLEGLAFPEGPRWHEGRLFFSDQHAHQVLALDPAGGVEEIVRVEQQPSGLGWTPDGRMLIVSMLDRRLLRFDRQVADGTGLTEVADLSALASFHCNDMVVAPDGRAYVGNFGFDLDAGEPMRPATIIAVAPDGTASVAADEMRFPNGTVITPDGCTLIVAESAGSCLTAFTIEPDGTLSGRRVWAQLVGATPDGICLDAEGAIWIACPISNRCLRVAEGGAILEEIATDRPAFACMLGGNDRRTLYVCTSEMSVSSDTVARRPGRIQTRDVDVAGVGFP